MKRTGRIAEDSCFRDSRDTGVGEYHAELLQREAHAEGVTFTASSLDLSSYALRNRIQAALGIGGIVFRAWAPRGSPIRVEALFTCTYKSGTNNLSSFELAAAAAIGRHQHKKL